MLRPSIEGATETLLKVKPKKYARKTPRRTQRTREASREDVIAMTRQFFATVNERNRGITTEGPIETSSDICGGNENDVPVMSTSVAPTTPVVPEAETTETETRSSRIFLPNGLLLDLLLHLPVDQQHGYNIFQKDK